MNNTDIDAELLEKFYTEYNQNIDNKNMERKITKEGIYEAILNKEVIEKNKRIFNIELPQIKRENQKETGRCWIFAGINFLKFNICKTLNCDINEINLSFNYLSFYDKLEKFNYIYEMVIDDANKCDINILYKIGLTEGGYWTHFVKLVEKYGLAPTEAMPENKISEDSDDLLNILNLKLKQDIDKLLEQKENSTQEELRIKKQKMLYEVYTILSKTLGNPITKFNFEYKNNNNEIIKFNNITPIELKNKIISLNLNDYVSVASFEMKNKEYYVKYKREYSQNIINVSTPEYINLPINELKELVIKQLKDGIPVRFSSEVNDCIDSKSGVMDYDIYNYYDMFGIEKFTRKQLLDTKTAQASHAMLFSGVHIENDMPVRWKIEDSRNTTRNYNGYYVMNDNFFDKYVYGIYINKKYLSERQLEVLNSKPVNADYEDPF